MSRFCLIVPKGVGDRVYIMASETEGVAHDSKLEYTEEDHLDEAGYRSAYIHIPNIIYIMANAPQLPSNSCRIGSRTTSPAEHNAEAIYATPPIDTRTP